MRDLGHGIIYEWLKGAIASLHGHERKVHWIVQNSIYIYIQRHYNYNAIPLRILIASSDFRYIGN